MQILDARTGNVRVPPPRPRCTCYAAFTLSGFDDQERNLTFVKTAFQVLKLKFLAPWQLESTFIQAFHSVPGCQTCMCKRGISHSIMQAMREREFIAQWQEASDQRDTQSRMLDLVYCKKRHHANLRWSSL